MNTANLAPECPVCFDPMVKDLATTNCGHIFHFNCLKRAIQGNKICPICRAKITTNTKIHYEIKTPRKIPKEVDEELEGNKTEEQREIGRKRLIEENIKLIDENQRYREVISEMKIGYDKIQSEIETKIEEFQEIGKQNKDLKNKLISTKCSLEESKNENENLKEELKNKEKEVDSLNARIKEFEDHKKQYEAYNDLLKDFEEHCGKEIDYKEIIRKNLNKDGEKAIALYVYTLDMKYKNFKEESEKQSGISSSKLIENLSIKDMQKIIGDNKSMKQNKEEINNIKKNDSSSEIGGNNLRKRIHSNMIETSELIGEDKYESALSKNRKMDSFNLKRMNYFMLKNGLVGASLINNNINKPNEENDKISAEGDKRDTNSEFTTRIKNPNQITHSIDNSSIINEKNMNKLTTGVSKHENIVTYPLDLNNKNKINLEDKKEKNNFKINHHSYLDFLYSRNYHSNLDPMTNNNINKNQTTTSNFNLNNTSNGNSYGVIKNPLFGNPNPNVNKIDLNKSVINISNNPFLNSFLKNKK